jgi:Leucine-rich repeat (LRR) protein
MENKESLSFNNLNFIQWLKNKLSIKPNYVKDLIGEINFQSFNAKFIERNPNMTSSDFAEMLMNELEMIRFTQAANSKYAEGIIYVIKSNYENEKKALEEEKIIRAQNNEKLENYLRLLDCTPNEFKSLHIDPKFNVVILEKFLAFKNILLDKFRCLSSKFICETDYISIIQIEHLKLFHELKELANNFNKNDSRFFNIKLSELQREIENQCCICCVEYLKTDELIILKCCHMFHAKCLQLWFVIQIKLIFF